MLRPDPLSGGVSLTSPGEGHTDITMVEELVQLKVSATTCHTHVSFTLKNTGQDTNLEVGFPFAYPGELKEFTALVDGKAAETAEHSKIYVTPLKQQHTGYWRVWKMNFRAGESHNVEVAYTSPTTVWMQTFYFDDRTSPWYHGAAKDAVDAAIEARMVRYILMTGSYWKGPIGRCRIEMTLDGLTKDNVRDIQPAGATVSQNSIIWDLHDLKPEQDMIVTFHPHLRDEETIGFLENLQTQHPDDFSIIDFLSREYSKREETFYKREEMFYRRVVLNWQGPLVLWGPPPPEQPADQHLHSQAILDLALKLTRTYQAEDVTGINDPISSKLVAILTDALRQLDAAALAQNVKESQRASIQAALDWCQKHRAKR